MRPATATRKPGRLPDKALTTAQPVRPDRFVLPPVSNAYLDYTLDQIINPHPDIKPRQHFSAMARMFAQEELSKLSSVAQPASFDEIKRWLVLVYDAVSRKPSEAEFDRLVGAIFAAGQDIPRVAWTPAALRIGIRQWKWMPSAAEVFELVTPPVRPLISRIRALRRIIESVG